MNRLLKPGWGVIGWVMLMLPATVSAATTTTLAQDGVWKALLHYEPGYLSGVERSDINKTEFFFDANGADDPRAELEATISAFLAPVAKADNHARCRFPARFMWLRQSVQSLQHLPDIDCPAFNTWLGEDAVTSISMVFAAGHMKSPASFFGHNFLKFNRGHGAERSVLLDETINYGADVPDNHGGLTYFYQGIFGGYSAVYERQPFYRHMAKYGEEDLRDVWEYELSLSEFERDFIVAHTWELQQADLTYYFFRKNCAYQIARLLALVTPAELVPQYMPWTMPYNVFSALMKVQREGQPLVGNIIYHPSRRSRFHQRYFALTAAERQEFINQVARKPDLDQLGTLESESQVNITDALIDYYEFRLRLDGDDEAADTSKSEVLMHRFKLPTATDNTDVNEQPFEPHLAQRPGYLGVAAVSNETWGEGVALKLRPAYFDFLSLDIGRSTEGEFTVLDTELFAYDNTVRLRRFDLLNVTNLAPSVTGVAGDSGASWMFRFGFNNTNNSCQRCLRPMLEWQRGFSTRLTSRLTGFLLAGGKVQKSAGRDNTLVVKTRAGLTGRLAAGVRVHAALERHEDTGRHGLDRNRLMVDLRMGERPDWDIRVRYLRDVVDEWSITVGWYW